MHHSIESLQILQGVIDIKIMYNTSNNILRLKVAVEVLLNKNFIVRMSKSVFKKKLPLNSLPIHPIHKVINAPAGYKKSIFSSHIQVLINDPADMSARSCTNNTGNPPTHVTHSANETPICQSPDGSLLMEMSKQRVLAATTKRIALAIISARDKSNQRHQTASGAFRISASQNIYIHLHESLGRYLISCRPTLKYK